MLSDYERRYAKDLIVASFFFLNNPATTEIYTLSLHAALPIFPAPTRSRERGAVPSVRPRRRRSARPSECRDRKSTRLNSSHSQISYAVFCLKKTLNRLRKETNIRSRDSFTSSRV